MPVDKAQTTLSFKICYLSFINFRKYYDKRNYLLEIALRKYGIQIELKKKYRVN